MRINWMGRNNDSTRLWIDAKVGRWWYVFYWRKNQPPYFYRSLDATPPRNNQEGKIYFGGNSSLP